MGVLVSVYVNTWRCHSVADMQGEGEVARGAGLGIGGAMVMLPWECGLSNYQVPDGMLSPMTGEAAWERPEGRKVYFVGQVKKLRYAFLG